MSVFAFEGIGTHWEVETPAVIPEALGRALLDRVEAYDRAWSRFRPDSLVARIAREPGAWRLPTEAAELLEIYRELYMATDGRMSPLVGSSLDRLGYDAALTLRPSGPAVAAPRWEDAIAWDGAVLTAPRPVVLDLGAAGKGQLCDLLGAILDAAGIGEWVVDGSGDILVRGAPVRIALEHPADPTRAIGVAELADGALCASAVNRRAWPDGEGGELHHLLDATTGLPVAGIVATWVAAPTAAVADAVATALFLTHPSSIPAGFDAEWVRMDSAGRADWSPGFPGEVFV